jgi:hypothetical protein
MVSFHVPRAASMKMTVFSDVALCSLLDAYRRFRGAFCLHHVEVKMEAASTSKTSANLYQCSRRNTPEGSNVCYRVHNSPCKTRTWARWIPFTRSHPVPSTSVTHGHLQQRLPTSNCPSTAVYLFSSSSCVSYYEKAQLFPLSKPPYFNGGEES